MSRGDWDIFGDLARLRRNLDRFSSGARAGGRSDEGDESWAPAVDIYEQEGALVLLVDLPGVKREDIQLNIDHDSVTVEGQRPCSEAGTGIRLERPAGQFRRAFKIGVPVDPNGVQAVYREGVLRITMPRAGRPESVRLRVDVE
jgi:HSP20 family protein